MINTKPTPRHTDSIKKYKKLFEKWDMWDFAFFDGAEYYFLVQYSAPVKGISGYLILNHAGDVIPASKAKEPFRHLVNYNTMMSQAISGILPQMKKPMGPFEERAKLLKQYQQTFRELFPIESASVDRIIFETSKTLENPKILNDIYYTLADYQKKIKNELGYIDLNLLNKVRDTFNQNRVLMYTYGLRERSLNKDYDAVVNVIDRAGENIPSRDREKIKKLLNTGKDSNQGALEKSMRQFEWDEKGNKVYIDESRLEESLEEKFDNDGKMYFEEHMIIKLRNP